MLLGCHGLRTTLVVRIYADSHIRTSRLTWMNLPVTLINVEIGLDLVQNRRLHLEESRSIGYVVRPYNMDDQPFLVFLLND